MAIPFDPLTGLPARQGLTARSLLPRLTLGPGPAESKSPLLGGWGNVAPGDPLGTAPAVPRAKTPAITATSNYGTIPVASPAAAAVPSIGDLQALIEGDSLYQQTKADIGAARAGDQATRTAARQRALTQYGAVPDLSSAAGALGLVGADIGGDITDTVRGLANANTSAGLSTTAHLDQAYKDAVNFTKNDLTARGLLSSGETGYQLGRQQQAYTSAKSDALQQLLDYLSGIQNNYLGNENQRLAALAAAAQGAAGRIPATTAPAPDPTLFGAANLAGQPITVTAGVNDQVPRPSLPDFTNADLTGYGTPADLQAYVSRPRIDPSDIDPFTGLPYSYGRYPASTALPVAIRSIVNPTGLSANRTQGVFAVR